MRRIVRDLTTPVLASLIAIVIGAIVAAAIGYNPLDVYGSMLSGAFGGTVNIANTLAGATPLIFTGLGIAVAFKAGLFNIGAEGQYWVAVTAGAWTGYHFTTLPGWLHIILILVVAMAAGALWASIIPGLAKAYRGAHEVITTMMLSYVGMYLARYMVEDGPMKAPGYSPESPPISKNTWFPYLVTNSQLTVGIVIGIVAAVLVWYLLRSTTTGYQIRMVGLNPRAARYAGVSVAKFTILSLAISGLFAGLAGGVQLLAMDHRLQEGFGTQYGTTGIVVALLARNNPFGVILAALFFSALNTGGQNMQMATGIPSSLTDVLTGLIVFFVAAERLIPQLIQWYRRRVRRSTGAVRGGQKTA